MTTCKCGNERGPAGCHACCRGLITNKDRLALLYQLVEIRRLPERES
jgi:hypothetical protein